MIRNVIQPAVSRHKGFFAWAALTALSAAAAAVVGGDMVGVAFGLSVCGLQSPVEMSLIGAAAENAISGVSRVARA